MPHRRRVQKGSFDSHFDELVVQFSDESALPSQSGSAQRPTELQERIDIHALLFQRAWQLDSGS